MGRTAIPHVLLAIAALICGTVLACLGHPNESYVAFGLVGVGGLAAAAVTVPAGTPGTPAGVDLAGALQLAQRAMTAAGDTTVSFGAPPAATPPAPPVDVPPPPVVTP